jgi:hypothetical protein
VKLTTSNDARASLGGPETPAVWYAIAGMLVEGCGNKIVQGAEPLVNSWREDES